MEIKTLLKINREEILKIASQYGAYDIRIFGSTARGDTTPDSDIDILVNLEPGRSLMDLGGLQFELQSLLEVPVDVVTENGLRPRIREKILHEAVSL